MFEDEVNDEDSSAFDDSKANIWPPEQEFHKTEEELAEEEQARLSEEQEALKQKVLDELQETSSNMFDSVEDFLSDLDNHEAGQGVQEDSAEFPGIFQETTEDEPQESLFDNFDTEEKVPESEPAFSEEILAEDELSAQFDKVSAAFDDDSLVDNQSYLSEDEAGETSSESIDYSSESNSDEMGYLDEEEADSSVNDLHTLFGDNNGSEADIDTTYENVDIFDENYTEPETEEAKDENLFIDQEGLRNSESSVNLNSNTRAFSYQESNSLDDVKSDSESNSSLIFLLIAILVFAAYWTYQSYSNRYSSYTGSSRSRRARSRQAQTVSEANFKKNIWAAVDVKDFDKKYQDSFIKESIANAGRENPFLLPDTAIKAIANNKYSSKSRRNGGKGDRIKKKAYRATMVGVLESEGEVLALVNLKEASFDVLESVSRSKVIKAAVKAMRKAKYNTVEVAIGDYIGNWEITEIASPDYDLGADPFIKIQREKQSKILYLGKPEELGIFNAMNEFDSLTDFEDDLE